jgi:hypothetical protein
MVKIEAGMGKLGRIKISGPAVEALDKRKENNSHKLMTNDKLRSNLKSVKRSMISVLRSLYP